MKKVLPAIFVLIGIVLLIGSIVLIKNSRSPKVEDIDGQDETTTEIPVSQQPTVALIPKADGHWLKLQISNLKIEAKTLDYELLYKPETGISQGVPGTVQLDGGAMIERDLLLGSESSGKFRYDAGVETGTLTLRFRNDKGKLVGKMTTDFHLQSNTDKITSVDGKFTYKLDKKPKSVFFVTMKMFGTEVPSNAVISDSGYVIFASDSATKFSGKVELQ